MASEMLNACLTGELNVDKVTEWLTAGNGLIEPLRSTENSKCDKGNFVLYFLKYLRDETTWLLKTNPGQQLAKVKDCKKLQSPEQTNFSRRKSKSSKVELFPSNDSFKNRSPPYIDKHFQNISGGSEVEMQLCSNTPIKRLTSQYKFNETNFGDNVRNTNSRRDISYFSRDCTPVKKFHPLATSSADSSPVHQTYSPVHTGWQDPSFSNGLDISCRDKTPVLQKTNKLHSPLNLGDFIVEESFRTSNRMKSNSKASSQNSSFADASHSSYPKRRIKPTQLHVQSPTNPQLGAHDEMDFGKPNRPSEPGTPFRVDNLVEEQLGGHKNFNMERDLLRQERLKHQNNVKNEEALSEKTALTNNQHLLFTPSKLAPINNIIIPQSEMVTHQEKLSILSCLYCLLLNENLVPNISGELHFIVSMLTCQVSSSCWNEKSPFGTVHNCVKFASSVLQNQCELLELTDTATLQMLSSNSRLAEFAPELQDSLSGLVNRTENYPNTSVPMPSIVAFHPDTDNRSNFPNDQSFHAFRKQRDAFYEILSKWEQSHEEPGWNFSAVLGPSVMMLLSLHNEPSNYIHLSRLFRMQLLTTCIEESKSDIEFKDGDNDMLSVLKDANPKKYALLYARLVTPVLNKRSPCPPPSFPGHQEFFQNFAIAANCSIFKQHLSDGFVNELHVFNSKNFSPSDVGDSDNSVDEETKQDFLTCLSAMKLLSKFLGFVNFLPYYSSIPYSEKIILEHCSIRNQVNPVLDILTYVQEAKQEQKLVYTIPWIVEYLAVMDAVTLRIPYYFNVLQELVRIYCNLSVSDKYTAVLIKLCLGWLFELPNFPDGLFFSSISNLPASEVHVPHNNMAPALDSLGLVDQRVLYICCPFWGAIKSVLANDPDSRNHITLRHITPVPADLQIKSTVSSSKKLQLQMEECFFHGHPASMRKSVEFVAERVASSFVKYVCNKVLAEQKAHGVADFKKHMVDIGMDDLQINDEQYTFESTRTKLTKDAESIATRSCISLKNTCKERMEGYCKHRISDALCSLSAEDIQEQVLTVCSQIAFRLCSGKISNWLKSHVTIDLFLKDFQGEINRTLRDVRDDTEKVSHLTSAFTNLHDNESVSPHMIMNKLRKILLTLITEGDFSMTDNELICFLKEIKRTLQTRDDVIFSAEKTIYRLTVDMFLLIASHKPEKLTSNVQLQFVSNWKLSRFEKNDCFLNLLCPRNLNMLSKTKKEKMEHCWSKMSELVSLLLNESFLTSEQLEDQCVAVFRQPWDQEFLKQFASCIRNIVRRHRRSRGGTCEEFVLLMELVSELCDDIENFDADY